MDRNNFIFKFVTLYLNKHKFSVTYSYLATQKKLKQTCFNIEYLPTSHVIVSEFRII